MFRSQGCLFWCGLVIWYYSPRDALARCPQSCEGWVLNDESSKESKSWENEELDDLNTTLTSEWTQTLTPNHISTPGILDPAWSGFWDGKKRERAVQDRPRFWAPGSSCFPKRLHCWLLSPTSISPTSDSPAFSGWPLQSKCQWIFYPVQFWRYHSTNDASPVRNQTQILK